MITHVVPEGVSGKLLLSGDRLLKVTPKAFATSVYVIRLSLLQINDKDLSDLTQSEVKDLIKSYSVGDTIKLQISRTADESFIEQPTTFKSADVTEDTFGLEADDQILEFRIPVNEKTAAGLGLSLKGKQSIDLDGRQNAAVFIDRVCLHKMTRCFKDRMILIIFSDSARIRCLQRRPFEGGRSHFGN